MFHVQVWSHYIYFPVPSLYTSLCYILELVYKASPALCLVSEDNVLLQRAWAAIKMNLQYTEAITETHLPSHASRAQLGTPGNIVAFRKSRAWKGVKPALVAMLIRFTYRMCKGHRHSMARRARLVEFDNQRASDAGENRIR